MRRFFKFSIEYILPLLLFIIIALLIFGKPLFTGKSYIVFDEFDESFPLQKFFFESVKSGTFPLWNPNILSGYPLVSQAQVGIFYPLTWIYVIFPSIFAANILLVLPYILSAFFVYLYTREIKLSGMASILSGLTFAYSGYLIGHFAYDTAVTHTAIWLPLILFFIEKTFSKFQVKYLFASSLCYGLAVLAGHGQIFVYSAMVILLYGIYFSFINKKLEPFFFCFVTLVLGGLLASIQILPSLEALQLSSRSNLTYQGFKAGSLNIPQILNAFFNPAGSQADPSIYILPISFILAILIFYFTLNKNLGIIIQKKHLIWFWILISGFAGLLILGGNTPLYHLMYYIFPYNRFRGAFRNSFQFGLALSILAGFGFDLIQAKKEIIIKRRIFSYLSLVILTVIFLIFCLFSDVASEHFFIFTCIKYTLAGIVVVTLLKIRKPIIQLALIAIFLFEPPIYLYTWFTKYTHSWLSTYSELPLVQFLKTNCPADKCRYMPYNIFENLPQNTRVFALNLSNLIPAGSVGGVEPVMLQRYDQLLGNKSGTIPSSIGTNSFSFSSIARNHTPLLSMLNTKYFLVPNECENLHFEYPDGRHADGRIISLEFKPTFISRLEVISYLSNSVEVADDQPVANLILKTTDGMIIKKSLRAGEHTAEWAWDRPDVKSNIKHRKPTISRSHTVDSTYQGHLYQASLELGDRYELNQIELEFVSPVSHIGIYIGDLFGYDSKTQQTSQLYLLNATADAVWIKATTFQKIDIYENTRNMPRAWFVKQVKRLPTDEVRRAIQTGQIDNTDFDPYQVALVENGMNLSFDSSTAAVEMIKYTPNRIELQTYSLTSGFLVLSEIYYPGWKAIVNGKEQPIYQTDYLLRGLLIGPGTQRIQFIYRPFSFILGLTISIGTLLVLFIVTIFFTVKKEH